MNQENTDDLGPLFKANHYVTGLPSVPGDTSEAAAETLLKGAPKIRRQVYDWIELQPDGATCDEVEAALDLRHQTASARVRELVLAGLIEDSGARRPTRSGRGARVYTLTEARQVVS